MADLEKVFDAIRNCVTEPKCKDCPWEDCEKIGCKRVTVPVTLLLDTLNLLKEQEAIEPKEIINDFFPVGDYRRTIGWLCGKCGKALMGDGNYCSYCGQAVKWE